MVLPKLLVNITNTTYEDVAFRFKVRGTTGEVTADSNEANYGYSQPRITSLSISNLNINPNGETATITVLGDPLAQFNFSLEDVVPTGWISTSALSATSGTIPSGGSFTANITIPIVFGETRTFNLVATNANVPTNIVKSGLISQVGNVNHRWYYNTS